MAYAGDLTPVEASALLADEPAAVLVDVRTQAEWTFVGRPVVGGTRFVEWTTWPTGERNPRFVPETLDGVAPDTPLVVLCRSGARSVAAAHELTAAGQRRVYNVLEGFEGDLDAAGQRNGGWKAAGLPWTQQ